MAHTDDPTFIKLRNSLENGALFSAKNLLKRVNRADLATDLPDLERKLTFAETEAADVLDQIREALVLARNEIIKRQTKIRADVESKRK